MALSAVETMRFCMISIKNGQKSGNLYADILSYGGRQMMRIPVYLNYVST